MFLVYRLSEADKHEPSKHFLESKVLRIFAIIIKITNFRRAKGMHFVLKVIKEKLTGLLRIISIAKYVLFFFFAKNEKINLK